MAKDRLNLIKDSTRFKYYKRVSLYIRVGLITAIIVALVVYLVIFVTVNNLQSKITTISNSLPQQIENDMPDPNRLTQVIYSYEKLKTLKDIYFKSPQYYQQYNYILALILDNQNFTIEEFSINVNNEVGLSLSSSRIEDLFAFIDKLKRSEIQKNFDLIAVESLSLVPADKKTSRREPRFVLSLRLQFSSRFNET